MFLGDGLEILKRLPQECIDLVITSPPFALNRQKEYGNEPVEQYIDWFMPFCTEIHRVLRPTGSFVLDIGGTWVPGGPVRSVYHFDLAVRLAEQFCLAQEIYWHNPARLPTPAEWVTIRRIRLKDAVNMVWWFSKTPWPKADNRRVLRPYGKSMKRLLQYGSKVAKRPSGHEISTKFQRDNGGAIPGNLLEIANTESNSVYLRRCRSRDIPAHPARYPERLVEFFVKFLTDEGDLIVDPFAGSNVTGAVCERLSRRWISVEIKKQYVEGSILRFEDAPQTQRATAAGRKRRNAKR